MFAAQISENNLILRSGPAIGYNIIARISVEDEATIMARNPDNTMFFVKSPSGTGWAMADAVSYSGDIEQLSIWKNPMAEHTFDENAGTDEAVVEEEPEPITGTVDGANDLKNGPSHAYETVTWVPENTPVTLQAKSEDNHWIYVSAGTIGGWLPRVKVTTSTDDLSILPITAAPEEGTATYMPKGVVNNMYSKVIRRERPDGKANIISQIDAGVELKVIATNSNRRWLFVISEEGDGWVAASRLDLLGGTGLEKIMVWDEATGS